MLNLLKTAIYKGFLCTMVDNRSGQLQLQSKVFETFFTLFPRRGERVDNPLASGLVGVSQPANALAPMHFG
jgi:hypothetical protein